MAEARYRVSPLGDVSFGTLGSDGVVRNARTITNSAISACPWFILVPEHYREDQTCRCDDPDAAEMAKWGYVWDTTTKRWGSDATE